MLFVEETDGGTAWKRSLAKYDILRFELAGNSAAISEVHYFSVPLMLQFPPRVLRLFTLNSFHSVMAVVKIVPDEQCEAPVVQNLVAVAHWIAREVSKAEGMLNDAGLLAVENNRLSRPLTASLDRYGRWSRSGGPLPPSGCIMHDLP